MHSDDKLINENIKTLRELTECTDEEAFAALFDCDNSIENAVEIIFNKRRSDNEWTVIEKKRVRVKDKVQSAVSPVAQKSSAKTNKKSTPSVDRPTDHKQSRQGDIPNSHSKVNKTWSSEKWDPYQDTSNWSGEVIEIVNSGTQGDLDVVDELPPVFLEESNVSSDESTVENTEEDDTIMEPISFLKKPWTSAPPPAFSKPPISTVFFAPGLIPKEKLKCQIRVGAVILPYDEERVPIESSILSTAEVSNRIFNDTVLDNSHLRASLQAQPNPVTDDSIQPHAIPYNMTQNTLKQIAPADAVHLSDGNIKSLAQNLSKVNVSDNAPIAYSQGSSLNPSVHQNDAELIVDKTQSHQSAPLHPNVAHYIGQLPHPYHLLNLPQNSGNVEVDQMQLLQAQRLMYDMQMQHQSAVTTSQTMVNPDVNTSKSVSGNAGHVNNVNSAIRPELLQQSINHHLPVPMNSPYPYSGLFLMNGFPGPYMNQQPTSNDGQGTGHSLPSITQPAPQNFAPVKQPVSNSGNYDLVELKFPEQMKSGYKDQVQSYANFPGQHPPEAVMSKMSGGPTVGMPINTSYNSNANGPNQNYQHYYHLPTAIAASAYMAAVSNHTGVGGANSVVQAHAGQNHQNHGQTQAMVMGPGAINPHHGRQQVARQH